jgi:hypothetical protein
MFPKSAAAALALLALSAVAAEPQVLMAKCGDSVFKVTAISGGHPVEKSYTLAAMSPSGERELYKSEEGGWFHAACLLGKEGKSILVFQSYCGGSACREGRYGAVDPQSLAVLLQLPPGNDENHKELSSLLGSSAPHLGRINEAFCCSR